jgi:exo-1,4-beta-D-glucosaminidase
MFEAFVAHKPKSTGLVQWKLNSAWPELIWQLYDTYLQPNGAFYAVKKACTPLHAIYRYGFNDIYLANEDLNNAENISVGIRIFDLSSKEIFSDTWKGSIRSNTSKFIYKLENIKGLTPVYFLDIRIYDSAGKELDNSFYWLSLKKDVLDYAASKKLPWPYYTPTKEFADYTKLNLLPDVNLNYDYQFSIDEKNGNIVVKLKNSSPSIAFFLFLDVLDPETRKPILPAYWSDNYVSLLPGEEKVLTCNFRLADFAGEKPLIEVRGWNVKKTALK